MVTLSISEVERWLDRLYIAAEGAGLRHEDRRKAAEVAAMLVEIEQAVRRISHRSLITFVDAAAGKSYLGLLAAKLVFDASGRSARVLILERDARRVELSREAIPLLETSIPIDCRAAEVASKDVWPEQPSIVAALHACGPAADDIIGRSIAVKARNLLLVPCCTSRAVEAVSHAERAATYLNIPRQAAVRRRFIQAWVDAERTWRLEASGFETEVVEFVSPTVTPHNLLWRSRRVGEPKRMAAAARALGERMRFPR